MKTLLSIGLLVLGFGHAVLAQRIETNLENGVIWLPVKDAATHEMLRACLKDEDPLTRIQALVALGAIDAPADVPLIESLLRDPMPAVREQAARVLAGKQPTSSTPAPRPTGREEVLRDLKDPRPLVQQEAVDAVARLGDPKLADALLPLSSSRDSVLRRHVCEALGQLRAEQITVLAGRLADDEDLLVRRAAADALVAIHSDASRDALVGMLRHPQATRRVAAARGLGAWRDAVVGGVLQPLLADPEPLVVAATATALGEVRHREAVSALIALVAKKDLTVAPPAIEALGKIGDLTAIPVLRAVLADVKQTNPVHRRKAFIGLRQLGDREMAKRAMQYTTEKVIPPPPGSSEPMYDDDAVRIAAVQYLQFIGTPSIPEEMLGRLEEVPGYSLRKAMAEMITHITGRPHRAVLTLDVRRYFIESLGGPTYPISPSLPGIIPATP